MSSTLSRTDARAFLVAHHALAAPVFPAGKKGVRALLRALRCIQLDPLDAIGTNADLVALARVDGIARGDVYRHLFPGHAFEHFAKERCLLPASAFPYYRAHIAQTAWWRHEERLARLDRVDPRILDAVLAEIDERGPIAASELTHRGVVEAMDWNGWKGTSRATAMAIEVLWTRCQIVVAGRAGRGKSWDVPRRALPKVATAEAGEFAPWSLVERVEAAGLLGRNAGAHWSMLAEVRTSELPDQLIARGEIEEVKVDGHPRRFLAPAGFRARSAPSFDDRMRILGPLDPLLWDRALVQHVFGFEYVWEVYKPAALRRWGWYVCPLLHRGELVGRIEARIDAGALVVDRLWREKGAAFDDDALDAALDRHAIACGASQVRRPRRARR